MKGRWVSGSYSASEQTETAFRLYLCSHVQNDIKHSSASGHQNNLSMYLLETGHLPRTDSSHQDHSDTEWNLYLLHAYESQDIGYFSK